MKLPAMLSRLFLLCTFWLCAASAQATIVQFQTVLGEFEVNLYDEATPETVANFLEYVESGAYENTFFHRLIPGFIIQGGGYYYDFDEGEPLSIKSKDPVVNEPVFSSRRGTIAMAKRPYDPDSATVEWFINLSHNHANLDIQNGGFTVFGEVI